MRKDLVVKTKTLVGSSDLTLLARLKPGLVPSLEALTYKTRVKRLLKTLNNGRSSAHEYSLLRAFSDGVERVGKIQSVRVAVVEPDQVLLSVTFDGGWESYLRVLWQRVGTLLDIIFCNTEGYVSAWGHSFEEWAEWVRRVQIETDFFYAMPGLTVDDVQSLRHEELAHRQVPGRLPADLVATRQSVQSAEQLTWSRVGPADFHVIKELGRQGLRALTLVHRLTHYFLPGTPDGDFLQRAARDLLQEFIRLHQRRELDQVVHGGRIRFSEQIDWLLKEVEERAAPPLPRSTPQPDAPTDVQGGILSAYPDVTHGCLLLLAFDGPAAAAKFLDAIHPGITREGRPLDASQPFLNIAFTCEGLRAVGLSEPQIGLFPQEFQEGMEARASLLGDFRLNHPRRWRLPARNWNATQGAGLVELSAVHVIVQLRMGAGPASAGAALEPGDALFGPVTKLLEGHAGVVLLSVQPMVRNFSNERKPMEHFGFVDGEGSDPVLDPAKNGVIYDRNQVQLGEFLCGYANAAELPRDPGTAPDPDLIRERDRWLHNGSFLVIRKLSQDVEALNHAVAIASKKTRLDAPLILAKMMGRWQAGDALAAAPGRGNDFDYVDEDPPGSVCPFHAHIRRANPRHKDDPELLPPPGGRTPRLMRRGMSYGPTYNAAEAGSGAQPRGMVFMAYNASIAEQFEVVQRWVSGGNSAGGYSGQSDPFLGVAPNEQQRSFRFEHAGKVHRIALDGSPDLLGDARPFVRLEWGAYLFTPSISVLHKMAQTGRELAGTVPTPVWSAVDGWKRIMELTTLEHERGAELAADGWKAVLEDPEAQRTFDSAGVWAAIRYRCGGVLRTPYGLLVADRRLGAQVLSNDEGLYSVSGYRERMTQSIGEIYLGLDGQRGGCPRHDPATAINAAIGALTKTDAFTSARQAATKAITNMIGFEQELSRDFGETHWELNLDVKEVVDQTLAALCQEWFGLPVEKCEIQAGGARWDWAPGQPPFYPGHFTAPSRYIFQPRPGQAAEAYGIQYGQALQKAFVELVKRHRDDPGVTPVLNARAPLAKAILAAFPRPAVPVPTQDDLAARTMVGVLMGFLPTVDGNLRLSIDEWLREGSFWTLRAAWAGRSADTLAMAEELLEPALRKAMQLRPSPELVWRTATRHHKLGDERVRPGDKVVVSIVSATHQCLEAGDPDVYPVFGGERKKSAGHSHACPAYEAAMGTLLGTVTALLEVKESVRPSVAPLALTLEGDLVAARLRGVSKARPRATPKGSSGLGAGHTLVADGDSWLCYKTYGPLGRPQNLAEGLATEHGFKLVNLAIKGSRLFDFYSDAGRDLTPLACSQASASSFRIDRLCAKVKDMVVRGNPPAAILLSVAGNDVVEERLTGLLNRQGAGQPVLDETAVASTVDGLMQCWLEHVLDRITAECIFASGVPIPVFLHGYDFPVPDGRFIAGVTAPLLAWLYPAFKEAGYDYPPNPNYPLDGIAPMCTLISRLNDMQARVAALPRFKTHVFHVNLTGTLSNAAASYARDWDNELHASRAGFAKLTAKFAGALLANLPVLQAQAQRLRLLQVP